jgi:hypothetical protein
MRHTHPFRRTYLFKTLRPNLEANSTRHVEHGRASHRENARLPDLLLLYEEASTTC